MRVGPQWEEAELLGLVVGSLGEFFTPIANLDGEQAGKAVNELVSLVVPHVVAFAVGDDGSAAAGEQVVVAGHVHPQVIAQACLKVDV